MMFGSNGMNDHLEMGVAAHSALKVPFQFQASVLA